MRRVVCVCVVVTSLALVMRAQQKSPVMDALRASLGRNAGNLVGAAEAMPADKYSYKPTPEQMSFADIVLHTAEANEHFCSLLSGEKPPEHEKWSEEMGKEKLAAALKSSFDFCKQALAGTTDAGLEEQVTLFGEVKGSKAMAVLVLVGAWQNHYAHAADYLRLNGVLPPSARKK